MKFPISNFQQNYTSTKVKYKNKDARNQSYNMIADKMKETNFSSFDVPIKKKKKIIIL